MGKAHRSLEIWRPQGVPSQPHSYSVMDKGPQGENELVVTLSSLNDRLYHVPWTFLIIRGQGKV